MQSCSVEGRAGRSTLNETSLSAEGSCLETEEACVGVQCTLSWKSPRTKHCVLGDFTHTFLFTLIHLTQEWDGEAAKATAGPGDKGTWVCLL